MEEVEDVSRLMATCWACSLTIKLPEANVPLGQTASEIRFKCGGCGADNLPDSLSPAVPGCTGGAQAKPRAESIRKLWCGRALLVLVPYTILFVGISSFYLFYGVAVPAYIAPSTLSHMVLAAFFEFQILWHFFAAALTPPGSPADGKDYGEVTKALRFEGFSKCRRCRLPRPTGSIHCSTCATCALDLDHHCIFVHNCIGYFNRRNFVLFCSFAICGVIYPVIVFFFTLAMNPDRLSRVFYPECLPDDLSDAFLKFFGHRPYATDDPGLGYMPIGSKEACMSVRNTVLFGLLCVKIGGVILGVGPIWILQVRCLSKDTTSLFEAHAPRLDASDPVTLLRLAWRNMCKTLGPPHLWLWPSLGPFSPELGGRPVPPKIPALWAVFVSKASAGVARDGEKAE